MSHRLVRDNNENKGAATSGVSVAGLLGIAFVILKLCHVIDWPWIWVTAPFWIPLAVVVCVIAAAFIVVATDKS